MGMALIWIGLCVIGGALSGDLLAFRSFPLSDTAQIIGLVGGTLLLSPVYSALFSFPGRALGTIFLIVFIIGNFLALMIPYSPFFGTFR
jgi:hypothetical protein